MNDIDSNLAGYAKQTISSNMSEYSNDSSSSSESKES